MSSGPYRAQENGYVIDGPKTVEVDSFVEMTGTELAGHLNRAYHAGRAAAWTEAAEDDQQCYAAGYRAGIEAAAQVVIEYTRRSARGCAIAAAIRALLPATPGPSEVKP